MLVAFPDNTVNQRAPRLVPSWLNLVCRPAGPVNRFDRLAQVIG
jgi:hypothetical protein